MEYSGPAGLISAVVFIVGATVVWCVYLIIEYLKWKWARGNDGD